MIKKILSNGLKVIYTKREGNLTSINIGFNAGAIEEEKYGLAHFVEHMVYKGSKNKSEMQINALLDEFFGFQNAMTNYPYVVYYGTCLNIDVEGALELFSDILINPSFPAGGFKEEQSIILEELKQWQDDLEQYCEDVLLFNSFSQKRIKERIIGTEESIKSITVRDLISFYEAYYCPENAVISIATSLNYEESFRVVEKYFEKWERPFNKKLKFIEEINKSGIFTNKERNTEGAKIQLIFSLEGITEKEFKHFLIFNHILGEGATCLLYNTIRTEQGLAYQVGTKIKNERGIKLFKIYMNTSKEKISKSVEMLQQVLNNIIIDEKQIKKAAKSIKLKTELKLERSIQLAHDLTTYELMYGDCDKIYKEVEDLEHILVEEIMDTVKKYIKNPSVQILK